jgi:hypothetical protein
MSRIVPLNRSTEEYSARAAIFVLHLKETIPIYNIHISATVIIALFLELNSMSTNSTQECTVNQMAQCSKSKICLLLFWWTT